MRGKHEAQSPMAARSRTATSSLLRHGVRHMRTLVDGLSALLAAREIESLDDIRWSSGHGLRRVRASLKRLVLRVAQHNPIPIARARAC